MELEFCDAFPSIGFPFCGAISAKIGANAVAAVLGLTISFKLGEIGIFSVAFNGAVHGLVANRRTIEEKRGVSAPLLQCLTEGRATIGIGPPLLGAFAGFLFPCCPFLRQGLRNNASACGNFNWPPHGADCPLIHHGTIDVPALANVEKAVQLQLTRVGTACSLLRRERLVPVRHSDCELHALKSLELSPIARASELFDGVIDDCHGRKAKEGRRRPCREQYSTMHRSTRLVTNLHKGSPCEKAGGGPYGACLR